MADPFFWNKFETTNPTSMLGSNCTDVGSPSYADNGKWGKCLYANAGYTTIPCPAAFGDGKKGAITFWFKPDMNVVSGVSQASNSYMFLLPATINNSIYVYITTGSDATYVSCSGGGGFPFYGATKIMWNLTAGTWYHFALCWKSTGIGGGSDTCRLYLNGSKIASNTLSAVTEDYSAQTLSIGYGYAYAHCHIDNPKFYADADDAIANLTWDMNNEGLFVAANAVSIINC